MMKTIKILGIVRHAILLLLVVTSVPLLRHYILEKPHHENIVQLHIVLGILLVLLSITGTILTKRARKLQTLKD